MKPLSILLFLALAIPAFADSVIDLGEETHTSFYITINPNGSSSLTIVGTGGSLTDSFTFTVWDVLNKSGTRFGDGTLDVIVYDPPHIPNQGKDNKKDFGSRFGLVLRSSKENHYTFTHTFPPFVREAHRLLKEEGILLAKITDYVHHHRYQWAHIELINAAQNVGFTPCDCIIKIRKGPIIDPKWKTAHHSRRQHCYWLVFRKSKKCE